MAANTNTWAKPAILLGLLGLVVAGVLALFPVSAGGVRCDSPSRYQSQQTQTECTGKADGRRTLVFAIGGPAALVLLVGFLSLPKREDDA
jgi:hypothetical protein